MREHFLVLLGKSGEELARYRLPETGVVWLGSGNDCGVCLPPSPGLGDKHAFLDRIGARFYLVEQDARGVLVDGKKGAAGALKEGMRLGIGEHELVFETLEEIEAPPPSMLSVSLLENEVVGGKTGAPPPPPKRASAENSAPRPGLPIRWHHFEVLELLGKGGFGAVYKARRDGSTELCALKLSHPATGSSEQGVRRFLREQKVLLGLSHPNIVACLEIGEAEGLPFIATEYVSGGTLEGAIPCRKSAGARATAQFDRVARGLFSALAYMHQRRAIHRDLKPANVLLTPPDASGLRNPKVADLGFGKTFDGGMQTALMPSLTLSGEIGGTLRWASPEQVQHFKDFLPEADLYSAAATLYAYLTGNSHLDSPKPIASLNLLEQVQLVVSGARRSIRDFEPGLERRRAEALDRLLAVDPTYRKTTSALELARIFDAE